jgi:hypothetical protein
MGQRLFLFLIAAVFLLANTPRSLARDAIMGVNRVNLNQLPPAERERIIRQMVENGVKVARLNIVRPTETGLETLRIARDNGLTIILNFGVLAPEYLRQGATDRPAARRFTARPRLSDVDTARFEERFAWLWRRIEEIKPDLAAIEFSNELNWADFNGDLAVGERGRVFDRATMATMPNAEAFGRGLDNYVEVLKIARRLRDAGTAFRSVPIVSAGTADIPQRWAERSGGDAVEASVFLAALRQRGLLDVVDGIGLHLYPEGAGWQEHIRQAMTLCGTVETGGRPCWITEWGVPNVSTTCPVDDTRRADLVQRMETEFLGFAAMGRVKALVYYDWDTHRSFSIWRCNGLTPTGRVVLD